MKQINKKRQSPIDRNKKAIPLEHTVSGDILSNPRALFAHNMAALEKRNPVLAERIRQAQIKGQFEIVVDRQHHPNLRDKTTGRLYYEKGDPLQDVVEQIAALKLKNARMAIFLGMGLGYELLYFMKDIAKQQRTNFILMIEKEIEIFIAAMHCCNLEPAISNPEILLLIGENEEQLYPQIRAFLKEKQRYFYLRAAKPVYHPSSLFINRNYYLKTMQIFREAATHEINYYGNDPYDSLLGVENMLSNLNEIVSNPGINLVKQAFQNRPAVIVSTGPSLNKNKHLLKGLQNKALIIAPDASFKILMDMGVKPHLIVSLERGMETVPLLAGFQPDEVADVYLAACPVIVNQAYQAYTGPRLIVYRNFDHFKWLGIERGILDIKLSSGNMGFKVAEYLGCDPIILIGQDLAFSREGTTHADGAFGEEMEKIHQSYHRRKKMEVLGNDGQMIQTNDGWYAFLKSYEVDLAEYQGRCINSTEGGAYINGTVVMPFQEAIDKYLQEQFDPLSIIHQNLIAFSDEDVQKDKEKVIQITDNTIDDMQKIVEWCTDGVKICQEYQEELTAILQQPEYSEICNNRLKEIQKLILDPQDNCLALYNTMQLFFAHIFQSFAIKHTIEIMAIPEKYDNFNQSIAESLIRQIEWYAVIGDLGSICLRSLQKARANMSTPEEAAIIN